MAAAGESQFADKTPEMRLLDALYVPRIWLKCLKLCRVDGTAEAGPHQTPAKDRDAGGKFKTHPPREMNRQKPREQRAPEHLNRQCAGSDIAAARPVIGLQ